MGCGSFEPSPAAPLGPGELRVLDVQRRSGGLVLATCQAGGPDERMDDLCVVGVNGPAGESAWTPCVRADSVRGVHYVRLLLLLPKSAKSQAENTKNPRKPESESVTNPSRGRQNSARKQAAAGLLSLARKPLVLTPGDALGYVLVPVLPPVLPTLIA